ncbi:MAG: DUF2341 domain-containing protein, partial [Nitrososphaeria archaeon]
MSKMKVLKSKINSIAFTLILIISTTAIPFLLLIKPTWSEPPWWNENWNFRKPIIIDHTKVTAPLENFPILIDIVDPDLTKTQPDGSDIVFTIDHNRTLSYEIEYFDSNLGRLVAWVQIPYLSNEKDTELYMYYGNPNAPNQQNSISAWDSNFIMVQHLEEFGTANRYDSTINANDGTAYGGIIKSAEGKIDGADFFDGIDDYIRVNNAPSINPSSAITIEFWMKLSSTGDYINLVNKGTYSQFYLRAGPSEGYIYWYVRFNDGSSKAIEGNIGWKWNTWHYLAATVDTQTGAIKVHLDGLEKLSGTFPVGKNLISTTYPLLISEVNRRWVKGFLDEVRLSNISRSPAWIQTCYNNQKDPTQFYFIGGEESRSNAPIIFENPKNEAADIYTNPTLSAKVIDPQNNSLTIIFKEKVSGSWIPIITYENRLSGTYYANATQMKNLGTTYYWSVCVYNGTAWTNKTFSLTTTTKIIQQKWVATNVPKGASGVLIADVNNDGIEEIFHAGIGGVVALNGKDGSVIWYVPDNHVGFMAQPQMADLNKDGILEIIVPLEGNSLVAGSTAGLLVLHANNGSEYWRIDGLGRETYSSPVICDIDGDGYPEIFFASTDVYKGLSGTGRITMLSYNGTIMHQVFAWRPCGGGLSIADTDGDGEFELYMGDRYMYLNSVEYGDNDYGKGVQSYWARNLTLRWFRSEIFCSSQIPIIADVNKDGVLDIIVGDMNGGVVVLNATDGSTIKMYQGGLGITPTHYQPSVYDIDGDGNLEILMADPHEDTRDPVSQYPSDDVVIWDLVAWKVDSRIYVGKSYYGPQLADVTGDGKMEIIVCNYRGVFIFDHEGRVLDGITGLVGTLNYAVAQDIDGDGYTELVVSSQSGRIYAFDTPARRPNPRPRTEVQFYSEYRRGAAEYVPLLTSQNPIIFHINPPDQATNVPLTLSQIKFTLVDYQKDTISYTVETNPDIGS